MDVSHKTTLGFALLVVVMGLLAFFTSPADAVKSPCSYCAFCDYCEKCEECPCEHVKECEMCKYCSYCKLCSLCSTLCGGPGGLIDSATNIVNKAMQGLGFDTTPDFDEVDKDIDTLSKRFTKKFTKKEGEAKKAAKSAKPEKKGPKDEL